MKKWISIGVLFTVTLGAIYAQIPERTARLIELNQTIPLVNIEVETKQFLIGLYPWLNTNQNELILISKRQSLVGWHLLYEHLHRGTSVYSSNIKVNISNNGAILSIADNLIEITALVQQHNTSLKNDGLKPVYANALNRLEPLYVKKVKNDAGEYEEFLINANGEILSRRSLDLYNGRKDTMVITKVFNPDPLTTAKKLYGDDGGLWVNKNGQDYVELNAQRVPVNVTIAFENDTFYTANKFAKIVDSESPVQIPYQSKINNFDFNRSHPAFREMMSLYHIEQYRGYLKSIGLPFDSMFVINVDVSAYQGQDQSRFSSQNGNPSLFFGTGGVPDAEDADVIIHEYTHGITYFIAPHTTSGTERLAFEEANCDFMACQYSKALSDFNWRLVFNWDGHNVYWEGRDANSPNKYPKDLDPDFYKSSVIWSSMLNDMSLDMGRAVTTRILIASMYSYTENMSMQQAAELLVEADSLLYGKMHFWALKNRLIERGFDIPLGMNPETELQNNVSIINSSGFATSNGNLQIQTNLKNGFRIELFNLEGKSIIKTESQQSEISISPQSVPVGMYVLKISSGNQNFVSKVVRVQ
ncbi:MAG: T9SS type A sorting domain-containing protein [Bacteroidota bacterium]|nr:T9SS type A sorting domain-containing protein [Bacteroidota bacterium]